MTTYNIIIREDQGLVHQIFNDPTMQNAALHCVEFKPNEYFTSGGMHDLSQDRVTAEKCIDLYMHDPNHPAFHSSDGRCYINVRCLMDLYSTLKPTDTDTDTDTSAQQSQTDYSADAKTQPQMTQSQPGTVS